MIKPRVPVSDPPGAIGAEVARIQAKKAFLSGGPDEPYILNNDPDGAIRWMKAAVMRRIVAAASDGQLEVIVTIAGDWHRLGVQDHVKEMLDRLGYVSHVERLRIVGHIGHTECVFFKATIEWSKGFNRPPKGWLKDGN